MEAPPLQQTHHDPLQDVNGGAGPRPVGRRFVSLRDADVLGLPNSHGMSKRALLLS